MSGGRSRRDRSRSPRRNSRNRRRENSKNKDSTSNDGTNDMPSNVINNMVNPMMMYSQGNMMMGGMYPNMIMQNSMMGGVMPNSGMEMMPNSGMEIMQQGSMDMSSMSGTVPPPPAPPMDMSMMGGMMMDASAMSMYSGMQAITGEVPVEDRKDIFLKNCKLSPPQPGSLLGPRRDKPLGCRTIFVGGLPDKIDEKTVREIFENYGVIQTLRLSTKNFCHIRFDRELCVDAAIALSGYHIKLTGEHENDDTKATTGILHVDYALSRDDQYDYERRQRSALRAQKEQIKQLTAQQKALQQTMNMDEMYNKPRSPSPIRIQSFSVAAVLQLAEKIKNEEQFANTLPTLIAWLERGDCSKKNSSQFYGMLQATNSHIRRLFNEKMQAEEELQECKERVKSHIEKVIEQLEQVAKVFTAATHQRVWDHFTKAQRKNIETWQKMTQEFNTLKEEFNEKFSNDEMDYNGANVYENNMDVNFATSVEIHKLKRENESLQFQLQAYQNEVAVIKADAQKEMDKFKAQFIARQALQQAFDQPPPLPETPAASKPPPPPPLPDDLKAEAEIVDEVEAGCGEAKLIGVMSAFLQVHPQGASLDYVVSYVRALFPQVTQATVHHVLKKHTDVFTCVTKGVGANIERRWSFTAFQNNQVQNTQVQNNEIQE